MSQPNESRDEETGLQEPLLTLHSIAEEPGDTRNSRGASTHGTRPDSPFAAFASQSSGMSQFGSQSLDRRAMNREASKLNPQLRYSQSLSAAEVRNWHSAAQSRDNSGSGDARSNWRRAGNKVMGRPELSRMLSQLLHQPGQLQGIDLKRKHDDADLLHSSLQARVNITCIDYSNSQVKLQENITNETLQHFLDTPRPDWSRVRWINIDGMSWDVIQSCALHFDLHPLCVEDCIHIPQRIKADFYDHFLYVSLNLVSLEYMKLHEADSDGGCPDVIGTGNTPSRRGKQMREDRPLQQGMRSNTSSSSFQPEPGKPPVRRLLSSSNLPGNVAAGMSEKGRTAMTTTPRAVEVAAEQVSIFLLQDNTIISMFQTDGRSVTRPLWAQLREPRTLARDAEDASYLLNLLLDAIVDSAFPVVEAFADLIGAYESCVLERQPRPSNTRDLHVVTGDLATLRRTIQPTYNLVTALRAHAQASQEALGVMPGNPMNISPFSQAPGYGPATSLGLADHAATPHVAAGGDRGMLKDERDEHEAHGQTVHDNALFRSPNSHPHAPSSSGSQSASAGSSPGHPYGHPYMPHHQHNHNQHPYRPLSPHAMQQKVLISRLTKTYLSDVQDHLSSTLDSINSLSEQCRDLIALIFNLAAHQTNQSMQALTVVSVLFLPLTFLAGIYGMNFDNIPELHWEYGYLYFYGMCSIIGIVFVITMARMGLLSTSG